MRSIYLHYLSIYLSIAHEVTTVNFQGKFFSRREAFYGGRNVWDTGVGGRCLKHKFHRG